jgi:hypothetical protein
MSDHEILILIMIDAVYFVGVVIALGAWSAHIERRLDALENDKLSRR